MIQTLSIGLNVIRFVLIIPIWVIGLLTKRLKIIFKISQWELDIEQPVKHNIGKKNPSG